jgi:hypothetical protein
MDPKQVNTLDIKQVKEILHTYSNKNNLFQSPTSFGLAAPSSERINTDTCRVKMGIRSEKCVVRQFRHCANVYLHKP